MFVWQSQGHVAGCFVSSDADKPSVDRMREITCAGEDQGGSAKARNGSEEGQCTSTASKAQLCSSTRGSGTWSLRWCTYTGRCKPQKTLSPVRKPVAQA